MRIAFAFTLAAVFGFAASRWIHNTVVATALSLIVGLVLGSVAVIMTRKRMRRAREEFVARGFRPAGEDPAIAFFLDDEEQ